MHDLTLVSPQVSRSGIGIRAVGIAASAGGLAGLKAILGLLSPGFEASVIIVQHRSEDAPALLSDILQLNSALPVEWAVDGGPMAPGRVYIAPGGCHLRLTPELRFAVDRCPRINHVWPSADVFFASLAAALGKRAVGVVLSGMGSDGSAGLRRLREAGAFTIAEDAGSAEFPSMPQHASDLAQPDMVLTPGQIGFALEELIAAGHHPGEDRPDFPPVELRPPSAPAA